MPADGPRSGGGSDHVLEEQLSRALHRSASGPVDVDALLDGSHQRARRLRTRRVAMGTAGVVLVIGLPVGINLLASDQRPAPASAAAAGLPTPGWTGGGTPAPGPNQGVGSAMSTTLALPGRSLASLGPSGSLTRAVAYTIPDSYAFGSADIAGLTLSSDAGQIAGLAAVHGQTCRAAVTGDVVSIAGREWTWTDPTGDPGGMTVTLTITGWATGQGQTAFYNLVHNQGRCVFTTAQKDESAKLNSSVSGWMGTSSTGTTNYGRAVVRIGDTLGGIEVQDGRGKSSVTDDLRKLAQSLVKQLGGSGTPSPAAS